MIPKTITKPSAPRLGLVSIYEQHDGLEHFWKILYDLLKERDDTTNISHKEMPAWCDHVKFIKSKPYEEWDLIVLKEKVVGACYLTKQNEIGIFIFKKYQGNGCGPQAVKLLMNKYGPRRYLANINPHNERSADLFAKMGFKIVQHTYACT